MALCPQAFLLFILSKPWALLNGGNLCKALPWEGDAVKNGFADTAASSLRPPLVLGFLAVFLAIKPHHLPFEVCIEFIHNRAFFPEMKSL